MCGIAGWVSGPDSPRLDPVESALSKMLHRGPDGLSVNSGERWTIGQTRLAIIDLTEAGQEPFPNEDETVWLTFNGEIYNFQQLRNELESLGHRFRSRTDAEVVLHGYEQWGTDVLQKLRGMFAFAIWDEPRDRLLLARDRVGKKPLFYLSDRSRVLFASELQGLLAMTTERHEMDIAAIDSYLSWGYIPAPLTGFEGIYKLPPAHFLVADVSHDGVTMRTERYWSLEYLPKASLSEGEAAESLRGLLSEAVRLRLISDVPLGAFLSGGIDSSIVVGLMAHLSPDPVKTFSIGFEEQDYSELAHARRIAELWSTDHHEFIVQPDALEVLPLLVRHYGEPYADSSAIPTYYVSKLTREHVTVALNGDGGDESFAGYERYWGNRLAERLQGFPGGAALVGSGARLLPDSGNPKSKLRKIKRFAEVMDEPMAGRYGRWAGYFSEEEKAQLMRPEVFGTSQRSGNEWFERLCADTDGLDPVDAAMSVDVHSYLPFDLLVKVDIASMANSLEARSPFLDHEVMEFAARLPSNLKLRGRTSKYLLRKTFSDLLPKENVQRSKMGFGVPVGRWLRGPLKGLLQDTLLASDARVAAYLDTSKVKSVVGRHMEGQELSAQVWNLMMLEMWHREVVDRQTAPVQ